MRMTQLRLGASGMLDAHHGFCFNRYHGFASNRDDRPASDVSIVPLSSSLSLVLLAFRKGYRVSNEVLVERVAREHDHARWCREREPFSLYR